MTGRIQKEDVKSLGEVGGDHGSLIQDTQIAASSLPGKTLSEALSSGLFPGVDDGPLRMYAGAPADAILRFSPSVARAPDGAAKAPLPVENFVVNSPLTTINFQTGVTSGAAFKYSGSVLASLPASTAGMYRRFVFAIASDSSISIDWGTEQVSKAGLENPGQLYKSVKGLPVGYLDTVATETGSTGKYKTAGSTGNVIESAPGGVPALFRFSGGGGETIAITEDGDGSGHIFKSKVGSDVRFRSLKAGTDLVIGNTDNEVTVASLVDVSNVGTGAGKVLRSKDSSTFSLKSVKAGPGVSVVNNPDDITLSSLNYLPVTQLSHGFGPSDAGCPLYIDAAGAYKKARADSKLTAEVAALLVSVVDTGTINIALGGDVAISTGASASALVPGKLYYLSTQEAGRLTDTETNVAGYVSKPLGVAKSSSVLTFINMRSSVVGDSIAVKGFLKTMNWAIPGVISDTATYQSLYISEPHYLKSLNVSCIWSGVSPMSVKLNKLTPSAGYFSQYAKTVRFVGSVYTSTVQVDGKTLVGGNFSYGIVSSRNRLVRLNADGTLDTAFCQNAVDGNKFNNIVRSIAVQSDGKILVGGDFFNYGGVAGRDLVVRLNSTGTLDTTFASNASGVLLTLDGRYYDEEQNEYFYLNFGRYVNTVKVNSDGKILIGGRFYYLQNGATQVLYFSYIALNSNGTLSPTLQIPNISLNGAPAIPPYDYINSAEVLTIEISANGSIYVGGEFDGGNLVACTSAGASIGVQGFGVVYSLRALTDGRMFVGHISGPAVLLSSGSLDTAATAFLNSEPVASPVRTARMQPDGKVLIGGDFTSFGGVSTNRNYLVRLNADGTADTAFCENLRFNHRPQEIALQPDGKILVVGLFSSYGGVSGRNGLVRLNADGTIDAPFCVNGVDNSNLGNLNSVAVQADGKILVGGSFVNYRGVSGRSWLVRLNADGTLDTAFCANAVDGSKFNNAVDSIAVQSDGKILVGGFFSDYAEVFSTLRRNYLVRLNANGTLDTAFCAAAVDGKFNWRVTAIAIQSDGSILVGGTFGTYASVSGRYLIRLTSAGTLDSTFTANAASAVTYYVAGITLDSSGRIYVSQPYSTKLVRLTPSGTLDTTFQTKAFRGAPYIDMSFNPYSHSDAHILPLAVDPSGFVWVAGGMAFNGKRYEVIKVASDGYVNNFDVTTKLEASLPATEYTGTAGVTQFTQDPAGYYTIATVNGASAQVENLSVTASYYVTQALPDAVGLPPIVGSYEQVYILRTATHTSIQTAIDASLVGQKITVLAGTYTENVVASKAVFLCGEGSSTVITGNLTLALGASGSTVKDLNINGNLSIYASKCFVREVYQSASGTVLNSGEANSLLIISDET